MNFAVTAFGAGIAASVFVAGLQGAPVTATEPVAGVTTLAATAPVSSAVSDTPRLNAVRVIDLRSGATCKIAARPNLEAGFADAPVGPDCAGSPTLQSVSQWRSSRDGTLEMADSEGRTLMRFMPGDGVLFESIYPSDALVTIVPARG
ncbi:hypothetical protein [Aurantimonas marianensis]|uniref:Alkaline proteinase inhibitor/ Outer membrane lipoprotein Omp19 domain-containing protein n=1 Tax=Aurantimonas marianensis TaxID=2920428 RepID=A0A9X2HF61_9HYPH|nr:hypothetical protein [Aurantimonas marianensis]MCP3056464.1 hypothetical protein [Aurantimonas marianensis]